MTKQIKAFFDTNILAYEFDSRNTTKQEIASTLLTQWRTSGRIVISTQVLQELFVVLTKKLKPPLKESIAKEVIKTYSEFPVVIVNPNLILKAISIKERHKFSFWDSLILSTAIEAKCSILFTEDLSHGTVIEGVQIINPFLKEEKR
ncbi:Predicted nucleic acid-binding protein, contains PIN domain [Desulfurobacterium pacificum]|uniref:Predicted nucleic acid-binding protein, contains PIN domain n=1 Tax=Desulfurobacterium pacificum TaxID=240166 RepID=A0ABY1NG01_9BACT|nr:PIN domain-containing protein [Desulfurobacterium pacificum]SMP08728.1 Predicted nucleic acid-binding protein, contains PIN domain [Desulfurobacterium pacificum]